MAARDPSGFASGDARTLSRMAEASEALAVLDAQEYQSQNLKQPELLQERDQLRANSDAYLGRAYQKLLTGDVSPADSNYRAVVLDQGNLIFNREAGASGDQEKAGYYNKALMRYQEAASLYPEDPLPWLYQGLCHERLTAIANSAAEKQQHFELAQSALRKALTLPNTMTDYSPALSYEALASLYSHMSDFRSALDWLKKARQADPASTESANLNREIQSVERYLARKHPSR